jgi:hypothetical protein
MPVVHGPDDVELAVGRLMAARGADEGDHTAETPRRAAKAWRDQSWGYGQDPAQHLTTTIEAPATAGLIVQTGIDVQSVCAHHLVPFGGRATVAYGPQLVEQPGKHLRRCRLLITPVGLCRYRAIASASRAQPKRASRWRAGSHRDHRRFDRVLGCYFLKASLIFSPASLALDFA